MFSTTSLLDNLISFDVSPDDDDLYVPSAHSSSPPVSLPPSSSFTIYSQNVRKSNITLHAVLSDASSLSPPADLILIQEPWYGRIGVNAQMAQGNPITDQFECPKHKDWQAIIPPSSSPSSPPDVIAYVPSHRAAWTFQQRSDIISHPSVMCLEIESGAHPFLVMNVYNGTDNAAIHAIATLPTHSLHKCTIFLGDFNLHHPMWSRDDNLDKYTETADRLVDLFATNGYTILNPPEEPTFFTYRTLPDRPPHLYTSTLDLGWTSPDLTPFVQNFQIANHLANGSDHYPLITTLSYRPIEEPRATFLFHDNNYGMWANAFLHELGSRPAIPPIMYAEATFITTVDSLQGAALAASTQTCLRRPKAAKRAKWWDSKVREALKDMRKA